MKFKIEKKSSSKIKFENQFREIEISKNQEQIDRGLIAIETGDRIGSS
jgi:hypothetical protein